MPTSPSDLLPLLTEALVLLRQVHVTLLYGSAVWREQRAALALLDAVRSLLADEDAQAP
jgi:hypothetical protein